MCNWKILGFERGIDYAIMVRLKRRALWAYLSFGLGLNKNFGILFGLGSGNHTKKLQSKSFT